MMACNGSCLCPARDSAGTADSIVETTGAMALRPCVSSLSCICHISHLMEMGNPQNRSAIYQVQGPGAHYKYYSYCYCSICHCCHCN